MARKYIGPPAEVLLLADGYKVQAPATLDGERLDHLIEQHPQLAKYYEEKPQRKSSARKAPKEEEEE
jgi:hypothetical protein